MSGSQPEDRGSSPRGGIGQVQKMPENSLKTPDFPGFFRLLRVCSVLALYFALFWGLSALFGALFGLAARVK